MRNYKIFVIILLAISITMTTSISYAQISEQIPSPKQQIDNGVAPHDVICKDGLVLVESSTNQIECIHETTAQKMGWRVISQPIPILEKTNVSLPSAYNSNEMIGTLEDPLYSLPTPRNASFTVTFPSSVSINETFDIEYTWIADPRYGTQHKNDKKGYTVISSVALEIEHVNLKSNGSDFSFNKLVSKTPELEFVSVRGDEIFHDCRREGYDRINLTSNNMDDRTGIFSYKFTQYPSTNFTFPPIAIFSTDKAHVYISAINVGNGIINLERIYPPHEIISGDPCAKIETNSSANVTSQNKTNTLSEPQNNTLDQKPSCITRLQWQGISENERYAILNNHTTCQLLSGEYITNLPLIGYQLFPREIFDSFSEFVYSEFDSFESFIDHVGITDEMWKKEFRSYYDNVPTKSYTHISKHILSPKQQVDSGVAPHDVICRNGLFLVERSTNEIACTHETTAQKMGWRVISQPIPILEETNVSFQDTLNSNKTVKKTLEEPLY